MSEKNDKTESQKAIEREVERRIKDNDIERASDHGKVLTKAGQDLEAKRISPEMYELFVKRLDEVCEQLRKEGRP